MLRGDTRSGPGCYFWEDDPYFLMKNKHSGLVLAYVDQWFFSYSKVSPTATGLTRAPVFEGKHKDL